MNFINSMLGDGQGNISTTRVIVLLVVLAVLVPQAIFAIKSGTPLQLTSGDLELLTGAGVFKLFQNSQETQPPKTP